MNVSFKNKKLESIWNDSEEQKKFFKYDNLLIEAFQTLTYLIDEQLDNIYDFKRIIALDGYNLEKVLDNLYSIRIIPKRRKSDWRLFFEIIGEGIQIYLIDINRHKYNEVKKVMML